MKEKRPKRRCWQTRETPRRAEVFDEKGKEDSEKKKETSVGEREEVAGAQMKRGVRREPTAYEEGPSRYAF